MPTHSHEFDISSFVDDLIPEHIVSSNPELLEFIKVYALYLQRESFYLNQLQTQRDIDLIETVLLTELQNEIGTPIPRAFAADPRLFYKHLVDFYRSRGTPESIKAFFRLIYEDDVEIYFPKEDMLIPSDGKWYDQTADIKAIPTNFTAYHTWSISSPTTIVDFVDDGGFIPDLDGDIITVNDTYEPDVKLSITQVTTGGVTSNSHVITFTDRTLASGDVVKSYRRGLFTTADGFTSDKKYIQDSKFYQKFSYVLKTGRNIADWKNAFIRLIHPAGFNFFGEVLINIEMLLQRSGTQPGYQDTGIPFAIYINYLISRLQPSEDGTFVEKTWNRPEDLSHALGLWDHFENIKFLNWRPISDYADNTIADVINKAIGTQIGCQIYTCTPNSASTDTSFESASCTLT